MYTGLKTIDQKNYYFKSNGVMAVSTSVTVNGITYSIAANGVATAKTTKPNVNVGNGNVKIYDTRNSRYYTMVKEYKSHPELQTERPQMKHFWLRFANQKQAIRARSEWKQ